ncbi:MAG: hypothetical protein E3K36_09760 [Candidatus Brocadia sp.]|nr:hypothetical protein [Candidatus Brocadia sp.]
MILFAAERGEALKRFFVEDGVGRDEQYWRLAQAFFGAPKDPLITLGTAPLDDPMFRAAVFEQIGSDKPEGAVTTDISGKPDAHAVRLDKEFVDTIRRPHRIRRQQRRYFLNQTAVR